MPALIRAKQSGLYVTVHIAELPNTFEENQILINMDPHRLGHVKNQKSAKIKKNKKKKYKKKFSGMFFK